MKKPFLFALCVALASYEAASAASIFWSFQANPDGTGASSGGVTVNDGFAGTPVITRDGGTGGSSNSLGGGGGIYQFQGTTYSAGSGNATPGYSMLWGTNNDLNTITNASFTVAMNTTGLADLYLRFDVRSATGDPAKARGPSTFSSIEYSIGGGAFIQATGLLIPTWANGASTPFSAQFIDLSSLNAIENQADVRLRFNFSSATPTTSAVTQNIRFDNLLITTDVIPEPSSLALLGLGTAFLAGRRRR